MTTYDTAHMLHHLSQWQSAMQAAEQRPAMARNATSSSDACGGAGTAS